MLNKNVSEIVEVLKGTELTEEELFKLMYENEKIYKIVLSDLSKEEKALSISNVIENTPKGKMMEKCYNENFESVLNALKLKRRMKIDEADLLCYMLTNENINQLVLSKFCSEKKARLIIKELRGEEPNTLKCIDPFPHNFYYKRRRQLNRKIF